MKSCLLLLLSVSALAFCTDAAALTNDASALAASASSLANIPVPPAGSELAAMQAVMLQLRAVEQRKAEAVATIPGMRQLDAQIADLAARLRVVEDARRALLASNRVAVASLELEAAQIRGALQRRVGPQQVALLAQKWTQLQSRIATNEAALNITMPSELK